MKTSVSVTLALALLALASHAAFADSTAVTDPSSVAHSNPGEGGALRYIIPSLAVRSAPSLSEAPSESGFTGAIEGFVNGWLTMVTRTQNDQPHWIAPLVDVTPCVVQEYRYDQLFQSARNGVATDSFGGAKGLELVPQENVETIIGVPAFLKRNIPRNTDGWSDWPFLIKLRLLSADEDHGNYIVTAFMGFSVPTGSNVNGNGHGLFTPAIAFGKGFENFDFQSTVGVAFPSGGLDRLGLPVMWNTAFQYHVYKYLWPELETNYAWQSYGKENGHNTLYLTPGVVIGRIPIHHRVGLTFGAGYQVAVTKYHGYNHNWILSARIPF